MSDTLHPAPIREEMAVNQIIREHPETVDVFNRFGIDACCGGAAPVREAAQRDGADPDAVWSALLAVVRGSQ